MTDNPFGDAPSSTEKRSYLALIAASKDNLALAQKIVKNIQNRVDKKASPLWVDSKGIGMLISTDLVAWEIQKEALMLDMSMEPQDAKGFMVVEIGPDWCAPNDSATRNWLSMHVGDPRIVPYRRDRRP